MGAYYSCNRKWCSLIWRLQNSAERRKQIRKGCKCVGCRPKFLRLRRKVRRRICKCPEQPNKTFQPIIPMRSQVKTDSFTETHACQNYATFCSKGTNTCFCESQDDEIQGLQNVVQSCSREAQNKNVCRFTVDAYFT